MLATSTKQEIARVEAHVRGGLNGRVRDFALVFHGEGVVLRGCAPTYYAKQMAQHLVMQATDLRIIANEIEVS